MNFKMRNKRKTKVEKLLSRCFICDVCKESFTRKDIFIRYIEMKKPFHCAIKLHTEMEDLLSNISQYPYIATESSKTHFKTSISTVSDEAGLQKWIQEFAEKILVITNMAITLWNILEASILFLNAICVLHEERFLAKIGWSANNSNQGFGEQLTVKSNMLNLVRSIRTVMRIPLIFLNGIAIVKKLLIG